MKIGKSTITFVSTINPAFNKYWRSFMKEIDKEVLFSINMGIPTEKAYDIARVRVTNRHVDDVIPDKYVKPTTPGVYWAVYLTPDDPMYPRQMPGVIYKDTCLRMTYDELVMKVKMDEAKGFTRKLRVYARVTQNIVI